MLIAGSVLVAACSPGSHHLAAGGRATTSGTASPASTRRSQTTSTTRGTTATTPSSTSRGTSAAQSTTTAVPEGPAGRVVQPPTFSYPTFIKVTGYGNRISIARLDDGQVVYTILPSQHLPPVFQNATRAPNGDLLISTVRGADRSWRHVRTGVTFPGGWFPQVSPDGSRLALGGRYRGGASVDEYDFATGRRLNRLPIVPGSNNAELLGFGWTPDSRSLVVAVSPYLITTGSKKGSTDWGGVYLVNRDAQTLPSRPVLAVVPSADGAVVYSEPAMLANGHLLVDRYRFPDEHDAWPSNIYDMDLSTGTQHEVAVVPIEGGPYIDVRGNQALISGDATVWLYDGASRTLRVVANRASVGRW